MKKILTSALKKNIQEMSIAELEILILEYPLFRKNPLQKELVEYALKQRKVLLREVEVFDEMILSHLRRVANLLIIESERTARDIKTIHNNINSLVFGSELDGSYRLLRLQACAFPLETVDDFSDDISQYSRMAEILYGSIADNLEYCPCYLTTCTISQWDFQHVVVSSMFDIDESGTIQITTNCGWAFGENYKKYMDNMPVPFALARLYDETNYSLQDIVRIKKFRPYFKTECVDPAPRHPIMLEFGVEE